MKLDGSNRNSILCRTLVLPGVLLFGFSCWAGGEAPVLKARDGGSAVRLARRVSSRRCITGACGKATSCWVIPT